MIQIWRSLPFYGGSFQYGYKAIICKDSGSRNCCGQVLREMRGKHMLWYVLQTKTGEEEKLIELIHKLVPKELYKECFVIYQEQLWRRQQHNFVHLKRVFPGYVFIASKDPEALFFCLKRVPAMAKLMADDESFFLSVEKEETQFLQKIMNKDHVIGLSYLLTDGKGTILQVSGPLETCLDQIVKYRYGKRHVLVRLKLLGREKTVMLGIVLKEDMEQRLQHGKNENPYLL